MLYLLGIDVSTTGVKALLIGGGGGVRRTATTKLPLSIPRPLWSEQDPADWWRGTVNSIRQVLKGPLGGSVAAVGLTGQMHGLTLLDRGAPCCGRQSCGTISGPVRSAMTSVSGWARNV